MNTQPPTTAPAGEQPAEVFIGRRELARRLGSGLRTIDTWTAAGLIPFYKIGAKAVRFNWSEVQEALGKFRRG